MRRRLFIYDFRHHDCHGARSRQDRRGARQLPRPCGRARHRAGLAVLFPQALLLARGKRRSGRAAARLRIAGLRGGSGAGHRAPGPPGQPVARLGSRGVDHGRQRLRRLRLALRRPGLQRAVQGDRRLHPARPAADRRPRRGPGRGPPPHLGQRGPGPGRLAGAGHAVRLRRYRRRPVPAGHPGTRRRDPHRHPHRLGRGEPRRRGGGGGRRGRPVLGPAAQPDHRGGLPPRPARRHAPRRRRRTLRCPWPRAQRQRQRCARGRRWFPSVPGDPGRAARGLHRDPGRAAAQARPERPHPGRAAVHPPRSQDGRRTPGRCATCRCARTWPPPTAGG